MKDLEATSLHALVERVLEVRAEAETGAFLWYRGVNCDTYKLLPKLMRHGRSSDAIFERERRLVTRFRQRSIAYWRDGYPQDDWEQLFAMQHYGLPTRLLDWSENLFVSAYFALSSTSSCTHDGACVPAIYAIDPVRWNRAMPGLSEYGDHIQVLTTADDHLDAYRPVTTKRRQKSPVSMYGTHNSDRIVTQRGTFVVWGNDVKPLDEFDSGVLWRIRLRGDRNQLFQDLHTIGFTETMVFPELTYLASELDRSEGWRQ